MENYPDHPQANLLPLIAVVDDDAGMRLSLDGLLRSIDHRTALFESAEALLASGVLSEAACVISDVNMPGGMSGLDLADRLAKECPTMPIILMTAFRQDTERSIAEPVKCFLQKPFGDEVLIACLEAAIAR